MKLRFTSHIRPLLFALLLLVYGQTFAATCTALANGDWSTPETWSCNRLPANGDIIVIPAGITVTISGNVGSYNNMLVKVYGTLHFSDPAKLIMSANGQVNIYTGAQVTSSSGNANTKIDIGSGAPEWDGGNGTLTGPRVVSNGVNNGILPVELIELVASQNKTNGFVTLTWQTASEKNNANFTLKHFANGQWQGLTQINGHGTSAVSHTYSFSHNSPSIGWNYYQLWQTDLDGTSKELGVVSVLMAAQANCDLHIYPNPLEAGETLHLNATGCFTGLMQAKWTLFNNLGQIIYTHTSDLAEGETSASFTMPAYLPSGIYTLGLQAGEHNYYQRVAVENN